MGWPDRVTPPHCRLNSPKVLVMAAVKVGRSSGLRLLISGPGPLRSTLARGIRIRHRTSWICGSSRASIAWLSAVTMGFTHQPGGAHRGLAGIRHRAGLFGAVVTSGPQPNTLTWRTAVTFALSSGPGDAGAAR